MLLLLLRKDLHASYKGVDFELFLVDADPWFSSGNCFRHGREPG
jgi:hypothetical protein